VGLSAGRHGDKTDGEPLILESPELRSPWVAEGILNVLASAAFTRVQQYNFFYENQIYSRIKSDANLNNLNW
jgi:hypothetical protein